MRNLVLMVLVVAGCCLAFGREAQAGPTRGQVVYRSQPCPNTACCRNQGWYPYYRQRVAPRGAQCRPPTWRPPYYKRVNYRSNWYGPRCYTRRSAACATRSAYYQQVMGR